jgi:hypothetical protein
MIKSRTPLIKLEALLPTTFIDNFERNRFVVQKRLEGFTLEEIGNCIGVTRERVRQINDQLNGPTRDQVDKIRLERYKNQIIKVLRANPFLDRKQLADELGIGAPALKKYLGHSYHKIANSHHKEAKKRYSNEELIAILQAAAKDIDGNLSAGTFVQNGGSPTIAVFLTRFGSWNEACLAAGITAIEGRGNYTRKHSEQDLLQFVASYLEDPKSNGTASGYEEWQRKNSNAPSLSLIRQRIGKWNEIKKRIISNL